MARILVIEDEPSTRLLLESRIRDLGHEVVACETGAMGLSRAREGGFDLFLVDVHLGAGIDGYEVCRRLRMMPQTNAAPVVLVSGRVSKREELHLGYEAGCVAYLLKTDMPQLGDVVQAMLRLKGLQDELAMQNRLLEERHRRLQEERQRGAELEAALRESGNRATVFRELAAGRPDGVLLVDGEGIVRSFDRGAHDVLGRDLSGQNLGSVAPVSGLEAFVRDAHMEAREGYRFDLPARSGRGSRSLSASVIPFMPPFAPNSGEGESGTRLVLLQDAGKRRLVAEVLRLQEQGLPRRELGALIEAARSAYCVNAILGTSMVMAHVRKQVGAALHSQNPVLLAGEPGVGKRFVARVLHYSGDAGGHFISLECAALSQDSVDAELFGSMKDAIPGAWSDRPGLVHQANFGTLFLADVEALNLEQQRRIVSLLEEAEVLRIGAARAEHIETRVIASSTADLEKEARDGRFLPELLHLLSEVRIALPALRQRPGDIRGVSEHLVMQLGGAFGVSGVAPETVWVLEQHAWPGNVRELMGVLERACQQCRQSSEDTLYVRHLAAALRELGGGVGSHGVLQASKPLGNIVAGTHQLKEVRDLTQSSKLILKLPGLDPAAEIPPSLKYFERLCLEYALALAGGDKLRAAKILKVGKSTFYRKLTKHEIS